MTTASTLIARVDTQLKLSTVATAAGLTAGTWASSTAPHVFRGFAGFLAGRNRGRLPFIEYEVQGQPFTQDGVQGGTVVSNVRIIAHVGGRDPAAANALLDAIIIAALTSIRSEAADNYMAWGSDNIEPPEPGPWGHMQAATLTVEHSYGRNDYD